MKTFFKAGLLSAAVMGTLAFAPLAHAAGYAIAPNTPYGMQRDTGAGMAIPSSELPMNRGVGRGSNKAMLDLNRGYGTAVTMEPMTGMNTMPSDRDRYAVPASGYTYDGMRDNARDANWRGYRDSRNPNWRNNAGMTRTGYNADVRARSYGSDGVNVDVNRSSRGSSVNSDVYTNPAIGEGSNRASSSLDNETR